MGGLILPPYTSSDTPHTFPVGQNRKFVRPTKKGASKCMFLVLLTRFRVLNIPVDIRYLSIRQSFNPILGQIQDLAIQDFSEHDLKSKMT